MGENKIEIHQFMLNRCGGGVGVECTCVSASLWWVDGTFCEWGGLRQGLKCLMGNRKQLHLVRPETNSTSFINDFYISFLSISFLSFTSFLSHSVVQSWGNVFHLIPHLPSPSSLPLRPHASPSSSELLSRRRSSSLLGALSSTSGMLTRNLRSSLRTVMVSLPLLFSTRCLVSSRDRFSVVMPLIWSK